MSEAGEERPPQTDAPPPAPRALVVDDDPEIALLLADILRLRRFESTILHTGSPVVEWVRENQPQVVLLDLMLPDADGYDLCEQLKLDRRTNLVPVVMVTARGTKQDLVRGLQVGANEYLVKPFTIAQLHETVGRALAWRREVERSGAQGVIEFRLKSETRHLEQLNQMLSSLLLHSGMDEREAGQLTTAVRELSVNAIEWGHRKRIDLPVTVTYQIDAEKVVVVIRDMGPGFNPCNLPHAACDEDPVRHVELREALGLRPGGFGIMICRGLVDELKYNETGNEVRLVKHVRKPAAAG